MSTSSIPTPSPLPWSDHDESRAGPKADAVNYLKYFSNVTKILEAGLSHKNYGKEYTDLIEPMTRLDWEGLEKTGANPELRSEVWRSLFQVSNALWKDNFLMGRLARASLRRASRWRGFTYHLRPESVFSVDVDASVYLSTQC